MELNEVLKMKNKKDPRLETCDHVEEEVDEEEMDAINNQLDMLNHALDELEQKNDDIHAQLVQLLESNRQARKQFQQMLTEDENSSENKADVQG